MPTPGTHIRRPDNTLVECLPQTRRCITPQSKLDTPCPKQRVQRRWMHARRARAPGSKRCATTSARRSKRSKTPCPRHRRIAGTAGRFVRTPWAAHGSLGRAGRRRRHVNDARPRVRESRRALLDRARRIRAGVPQGNSRRRQRSTLLGVRHFADRASVESACSRSAYEHAVCCHHQDMVRRRGGSYARARSAAHAGRRRHDRVSTGR